MKRPTVASLKKVTPDNLAALGAPRLAEILVAAAATRPELKRRLRMELAAAQGSDHLAVEIDRRLATLQTSRSKVPWRQRPTFVRDFEGLRMLIAERLAGLDRPGALERMWQFLGLARRLATRVRDKDGELAAVFARAAADLGGLIGEADGARAAQALADAMAANPMAWKDWLAPVLAQSERGQAGPGLAEAALTVMQAREASGPGWAGVVRELADAAGDADAFAATFTAEALRAPGPAAEVAQRLLAAGRVEEAGRLLRASGPDGPRAKAWFARAAAGEPDVDWESAWIDYLEASGQGEAAQAARWASFERTLSVERARAFTSRLSDFDDVEAESRAFAHAAGHADFRRGLQFLIDWPALAEAGRMVQARPDDIDLPADLAEAWAARLRVRQPAAAHLLLRKAAAAAFRRRDFKTCDRLTVEADAIGV